MAKKNEVAKSKKNEVTAPMTFEDDSNQGMENIDQDSVAIPFIKVLQKMSPICDDDHDLYVKGAKPGKFFHTITEEMSDAIIVVPCHFERIFNEWVDRDAGGGYKGSHSLAAFEKMNTERDEHGKFRIPDTNNYLVDTRNHYCLIVDPKTGTTDRVIFSMSSTQTKVSRKWLSKIANIKMEGANGMFTPPSFSHKYEITTITQTNDSGTWKLPVVSSLGVLDDAEAHIYAEAKAFYDLVKSGKVQASEPADESSPGNDLKMGKEDIEM